MTNGATIVLRKINSSYTGTIIGQDGVKEYLLSALYPLISSSRQKPVVLLFYGPTGVGKTETAKFLSTILEESLFRKQFSMFHNEDFVSYLFGGKHSENSFAKELLERESNIILLDEFDKPHPVFHSAFYQLFDEGVFEDKNYSVMVEKAIIICTSNYTSEADVRKHLGDPIYSRFDAVIMFQSLSIESIRQIISNEFQVQYDLLSVHEKSLIDEVDLKTKISARVHDMTNVRQIKKIVQEAISTVLVRDLLRNPQ